MMEGGGVLIYGFNEACKNISTSYLKVGDDSKSTICFQNTAKGNLPHFSYIPASQKHWGRGSRLPPVLPMVPIYPLIHREGWKSQITTSTIFR